VPAIFCENRIILYYIVMSGIAESKNLILLSKIAKEKKYAQEYLGLLARRGDLGSIRIGKRWYTTAEWFGNFLSDTEKRKEEMRAQMMSQEAKKTEEAVTASFEIKKETDANVFKAEIAEQPAERNRVLLETPTMVAEETVIKPIQKVQDSIEIGKMQEAKIFEVTKEKETQLIFKQKEQKIDAPIPKIVSRPIAPGRGEYISVNKSNLRFDMRRVDMRRENFRRKIVPGVSEKRQLKVPAYHMEPDRKPFIPQEVPVIELQPSKEIIFEKSVHNFSPSFTGNIKSFSLFFQKLAFSGALVLLFAVLSIGVFLYRKDSASFPKIIGGTVAGAEDTRLAGVSSLENFTSSYFEARRGQTKENISLSRVILEAALEKNQQK
jgi:hypothetical protein